MIRLAVPALLLVAGCAASSQVETAREARQAAKLDRWLAGLTSGEPRRCIQRGDVTEIETAQDTILYIAGKGRMWRNTVVGSCPGLARGDIVVSSNPAGRYCDGDLVQTRSRTGGAITGSCSLGAFTPYTK